MTKFRCNLREISRCALKERSLAAPRMAARVRHKRMCSSAPDVAVIDSYSFIYKFAISTLNYNEIVIVGLSAGQRVKPQRLYCQILYIHGKKPSAGAFFLPSSGQLVSGIFIISLPPFLPSVLRIQLRISDSACDWWIRRFLLICLRVTHAWKIIRAKGRSVPTVDWGGVVPPI